VDHVVVPLDPDHARGVVGLGRELATAVGCSPAAAPRAPHITLVSYTGLAAGAAAAALAPVAGALAPFVVRAHGYGLFAGDAPADLSLHVMVVRTPELDSLHRRVHRALAAAGAAPDGLTDASVWTPHITLLDRDLAPDRVGRAMELLACRPHRSWSVPVGTLAIARRAHRDDVRPHTAVLPLTGAHPA
jgi:2'-5' RNA ligase